MIPTKIWNPRFPAFCTAWWILTSRLQYLFPPQKGTDQESIGHIQKDTIRRTKPQVASFDKPAFHGQLVEINAHPVCSRKCNSIPGTPWVRNMGSKFLTHFTGHSNGNRVPSRIRKYSTSRMEPFNGHIYSIHLNRLRLFPFQHLISERLSGLYIPKISKSQKKQIPLPPMEWILPPGPQPREQERLEIAGRYSSNGTCIGMHSDIQGKLNPNLTIDYCRIIFKGHHLSFHVGENRGTTLYASLTGNRTTVAIPHSKVRRIYACG